MIFAEKTSWMVSPKEFQAQQGIPTESQYQNEFL